MGCIFSRPDGSRNNSRIFRVYNVDENGEELNSGKIQVSDSDLILFQKGKEEIRWPLRCLRRYGWDQELFSFESGRRCTTGPGIYAFKCRRAESLFNSVQECIQRAGQGDTATNPAFQHSRPSSLVVEPPPQQQHNGFVGQNSGNPTVRNLNSAGGEMFYMNTRQTVNSEDDHNYYNEGAVVRNMRQHSLPNGRVDSNIPEAAFIDFLHGNPPINQMQYIELDLPASTENLCEEPSDGHIQNFNQTRRTDSELEADGDGLTTDEMEEGINCEVFEDPSFDGGHQPAYINVGPGGAIKDENGGNPVRMRPPRNASLENTQPNYSNITPLSNLSASATPLSIPTVREPGVLNYIEVVNLNGATSTTPTSPNSYVPFPDSPSKRTESYTVIDFAKTQALSNSSKIMNDAADDGLRKTRHNSTINS